MEGGVGELLHATASPKNAPPGMRRAGGGGGERELKPERGERGGDGSALGGGTLGWRRRRKGSRRTRWT